MISNDATTVTAAATTTTTIKDTEKAKEEFRKKPFTLYSNDQYFIVNDWSQDQKNQTQKLLMFEALLGIIKIQQQQFLLIASERVHTATILKEHDIFEIKSVLFMQFQKDQISKKVRDYIEGVSDILSSSHYFSYTYALSRSRQRATNNNIQEDIFGWNSSRLLNSFLLNNISQCWTVTIIQGYVGQFQISLFEKDIIVTNICRRSFKRGGTRFVHRGIDAEGFVANFCENEEILEHQNYVWSWVSIRGSIPLFWEQEGVNAGLKINKIGEKLNDQAQAKHFDLLSSMYIASGQPSQPLDSQDPEKNKQFIHIINLLKEADKNESQLIQAFEQSLERSQQPVPKKYELFDFHRRSNEIDIFSKTLSLQTYKQGYFKEKFILKENNEQSEGQNKNENRETICMRKQQGVIRVNCKDCLDRTNSIMCKVSFQILLNILRDELNMNLNFEEEAEYLRQNPNNNITDNQLIATSLNQLHSNLWTKNGNNVSKLYAGTDATTKNGTSGFQYKFDTYLIGIQRFVQTNMNDAFKMECINLITGQHFDTQYNDEEYGDSMNQELLNKRQIYQTRHNISIFVTTWNVMSLVPNQDIVFPAFFDLKNEQPPDLIAVGLEDIVKASKFGLFGKVHNEKITNLWTEILESHLKKNMNRTYIKVNIRDMVGNFLAIFVSQEINALIKNVETESVKCGFAKKGADVGALICRLTINETLICFVHCCLPGGRGTKKIEARYEALNHIRQIAFQKQSNGKSKTLKIDQSDFTILFGDMNFRVKIDKEYAHFAINKYNYFKENKQMEEAYEVLKQLQQYDQLISTRHESSLSDYVESMIDFAPTFYPPPSSHDQTPSWRSRILFSLNSEDYSVNQRFYQSNDQLQACNHRQVSSYFEINTKKTDLEAKNKIVSEILSQQKHEMNQQP